MIYEKLRKIEMKTNTHRKCEIHKGHKVALELLNKSECVIQVCGNKIWRIKLYNSKGTYYIIQELKSECDCPLRCSQCNSCTHMYSCSCLDATIHSTVCKHVHLLRIELLKLDNVEDSEQTCASTINDGNIIEEQANDNNISDREEDMEIPDNNEDVVHETMDDDPHEYLLGLLNADPVDDLMEQQDDLKNITQQVLTLAQTCNNVDVLKTVKKHLHSATSLLRYSATIEKQTLNTVLKFLKKRH